MDIAADMTDETTHWLHHPELGELPARAIIDCVFALTPNDRILHLHNEQVEIESRDNEHHYNMNGNKPKPERSRCQVIPPFVNAFSNRR